MRSQKIVFACLILISLTIATALPAPYQATLTPRQILARMAEVYANCTSPQLNIPIEQSNFQFQPPPVR